MMRTLTRVLALMIVACVVGPTWAAARQPDPNREIEKLSSADPIERETAARILGNLRDPGAVEPLIGLLQDENQEVRMTAVAALRWIKDARAVEPLIATLEDENREVRNAAAGALGQFRDPRATAPLLAAFAVWPSMSSVGPSLRDIGRPAVEPLNAALRGEDPAVRAMAARTLGQIGDPGAVEPLISSLKDQDRDVRENAAAALRWIKDPRAVEPLIATLRDENGQVRETTVQALGQFRDPRAAAPLIAAFGDWPSLTSVSRSLQQIGKPAVEPLITALRGHDPAVRAMAATTLGGIGDPRAVESLIPALKDENREVRMSAATALRWLRDTRAVEPLIAAMQDEDEGVRSRATDALKAIAGRDLGKDPEAWRKWRHEGTP